MAELQTKREVREMLQTKSFIVIGNTTTKNGVKVKDLAENVDRDLNSFLEGLSDRGGKLVDVKINTEFIGASGDYAFVTVLFEIDKPAPKSKK
jgi:hypothetical protein